MNKHRRRNLQIMLEDWARYESEVNGYPGQTAESCAGEGRSPGKPRSRLPRGVYTPTHITRVRRAVAAMGSTYPNWRVAVEIKYGSIPGDAQAAWKSKTGKSESNYFDCLGRAEAFLEGRLLG